MTDPRSLPAENIDRMIALRKAGMTVRQVAAETGHCTSVVQKYTKQYSTRPDYFATAREIDMIIELREEGETIQGIADQVGRSLATVHRYAGGSR